MEKKDFIEIIKEYSFLKRLHEQNLEMLRNCKKEHKKARIKKRMKSRRKRKRYYKNLK